MVTKYETKIHTANAARRFGHAIKRNERAGIRLMQASAPDYCNKKEKKEKIKRWILRPSLTIASVSETEDEGFRIANPVWLSCRPENGDFSGFHFRVSFSG